MCTGMPGRFYRMMMGVVIGAVLAMAIPPKQSSAATVAAAAGTEPRSLLDTQPVDEALRQSFVDSSLPSVLTNTPLAPNGQPQGILLNPLALRAATTPAFQPAAEQAPRARRAFQQQARLVGLQHEI